MVLKDFVVTKTMCGGKMCDKQGLYKEGRASIKCPCIGMVSRSNSMAFVMHLELTMSNGSVKSVRDFSSEWWMTTFIFQGGIPQGYTIDSSDYESFDQLIETVTEVLNTVNENGGWDALGWAKWGYITDRAVEDSGAPYNQPAETTKVKAPEVALHVVSLLPSEPHTINTVAMADLKINLNEE